MSGGFSPSIMYIYKRIILYSDDIELNDKNIIYKKYDI